VCHQDVTAWEWRYVRIVSWGGVGFCGILRGEDEPAFPQFVHVLRFRAKRG